MSPDLTPDGAMLRLVAEIARGLVTEPGAIRVQVHADDAIRVVRLQVAANDFGKVVGRQGATAKSIRTIVAAAGNRFHQRYALEILESVSPHLRST